MEFSADLKKFVLEQKWTFAKTFADTWPHEYLVREKVDENFFVKMVMHIREHGYVGKFYSRAITYFDDGGLVYWTMGNPIERTTIINRCKKESSYESRLKAGTLPDDKPKVEEQVAVKRLVDLIKNRK